QARPVQAVSDEPGLRVGHIYDHQVLRVGGAQLAVAVAVREIGSRAHLSRRDASTEHGSAHVELPGLLLRMNSGVVTKYVGRDLLGHSGNEFEAQTPLHFFQETLRGPAMLEEEKLQTRPFAAVTQNRGVAKDLAHRAGNRNHLVPIHEGVEPYR